MTSEAERPGTLEQLIESGEVRAPSQHGMPDLVPELATHRSNYADILISERERERQG